MLDQLSPVGAIMDDVSNREFYAAFAELGDRLESKIDKRADKLEKKLDDHAAEDRIVANRVLTIETNLKKDDESATKQRNADAARVARRMTWTVFGMTTGATIIVKVIERVFR